MASPAWWPGGSRATHAMDLPAVATGASCGPPKGTGPGVVALTALPTSKAGCLDLLHSKLFLCLVPTHLSIEKMQNFPFWTPEAPKMDTQVPHAHVQCNG